VDLDVINLLYEMLIFLCLEYLRSKRVTVVPSVMFHCTEENKIIARRIL